MTRSAGTCCLLLVLLTPPLTAQDGQRSDRSLQVGRLPCARAEDARAHGYRQLVWEITKRTSLEAEVETVPADPGGASLFRTPFVLWSCEGAAAALDDQQLGNLRRFLSLGGVLWVDDPAAAPGGAFDRSVREILARVLPDRKLAALPQDHVLFRTFFLTDPITGRVLTGPVEGIDLGERLAVIVSPTDVLGALSRDLYGNWEYPCQPGGEAQREAALRFGINVFFYALCQDYKNDRVHLPFILKRRRL